MCSTLAIHGEIVQNMEQADLQQLENGAERILTAESLDALLA
ncbi:MAG: hypothetical protein Q7U98_12155 [Methylicorpusculum sp.]|nr:hypothetical protein [Methylicorpusculum sp.]MDO8846592.1 hypothetical protein [Methylicorpusculum sp.]MDO8939900.1 hypothetical protein [Methylicorpusculum sp.]MDO9239710.1 hypothetical protein [Methylicorpusculum sp.]MDP2177478.1 hypothetical protein [Methylicorpusculum sp.]MDP2201294.1 hypothetical protein [Methylicorpusculum sp.]